MDHSVLKVALAQIAPIWLDKSATIDKVIQWINKAGAEKADLVTFGEAILPGYPYWVSLTDGAQFNSKIQKEVHAHYVKNAIEINKGDLDGICKAAHSNNIAVYLGTIERAPDRGNHSIYCSLIYISQKGEIQSIHRKLQPTFEERLTWAPGDGNGLQVHGLKTFTVGGLNCWENWMPLSRTALYAMGENLHVAVWPGAKRNTENLTRFIAEESRSYSIGVSGLMRKSDFPDHTPHLELILENAPEILSDGGSCIAGPDGQWILEPVCNQEILLTAELDFNRVLEERQNFDPAGHYSRPDVTKLTVNRQRQSIIEIND
ncbi:carbon-nitrogen hydrolase family protein [Portibacter marinus]|uniref:carbon-nitrogen hydrolase family protein n=1 Tax=Portibacter marinus TaxID=2898660 RepID=UPI001F37A736|nr:carbon-nitrogen hydrolase family protein [Portibacter marinus]